MTPYDIQKLNEVITVLEAGPVTLYKVRRLLSVNTRTWERLALDFVSLGVLVLSPGPMGARGRPSTVCSLTEDWARWACLVHPEETAPKAKPDPLQKHVNALVKAGYTVHPPKSTESP
jgi:hypothetical protein